MADDRPSDNAYDVISAGELLADFISEEPVDDVGAATTFSRHTGGSPANLARNLSALGKHVSLVATVGDDGLGRYLLERLDESGVDTSGVSVDPSRPTSSVLIARSAKTPDFIHYREADTQIRREQLPDERVRDCSIFHTTCVALSSDQARQAIVTAAERASKSGSHLSIDANYVAQHWADAGVARRSISSYCRGRALVKLSLDDAARLFETPTNELVDEEIVAEVHGWGAELVCLTKGRDGSIVSWEDGAASEFVGADEVDDVYGATGAGDAFWSGFLSGWLDGESPSACAALGARVAAEVVRKAGPLDGEFSDP